MFKTVYKIKQKKNRGHVYMPPIFFKKLFENFQNKLKLYLTTEVDQRFHWSILLFAKDLHSFQYA